MEISLIRHGKSKHIDKQLVTGNEFKRWVERYDSSSVVAELDYPAETLEKLAVARMVLASDLIRSVDSSQLLHPSVTVEIDKLFRETELPIPSLTFKLTPGAWAVILRLLWLCGYYKNCESYSDAKRRAATAAEYLIERAKEYGSVALVGHGFFNLLIAKFCSSLTNYLHKKHLRFFLHFCLKARDYKRELNLLDCLPMI